MERLARLLLVGVAFVPLFTLPGLMFPASVGRIALFRFLIGVAGVCAIVLWVRKRSLHPARFGPVSWTLGAAVALFLVSACLGVSPVRSIFGSLERMWGVVGWGSMLLWLVLVHAFFRPSDWDRFFRISLMVGFVVSTYAVLQFVGVEVGWAPTSAGGRPEGTLGNPGYLGIYLVVVAGTAALQAGRGSSRLEKSLAVAVGVLALIACLLSGTRAALLGAGIGVLVGAVMALRQSGRSPGVLAATVVGGIGLAGVLALGASRLDSSIEEFPALRRLTEVVPDGRSWEIRTEAWRVAVTGLQENPWTGVGPENFQVLHHRHFRPRAFRIGAGSVQLDRAHNMPLQVFATTGVPGGLAYLAFWGALLLAPWRALSRERLSLVQASVLAGAFLAYFVYLQFWFEDVSSFTVLVALGAYAEQRYRGDRASPTSTGRPSRSQLLARGVGGLSLGAVVAGMVWIGAFVPARAARIGRQAERAGEVELQVHRYREALAAAGVFEDDLSHEYVDHLVGLTGWWRVNRPRGNSSAVFDSAVRTGLESLGRVQERADLEFRPVLDEYRLHRMVHLVASRDGALDAARGALRRLLLLSPERVSLHQRMAETYLLEGRLHQAEEWLDRAEARAPGSGRTSEYRAHLYWRQGKRSEAATELLRALGRGHVPAGPTFVLEVGTWLEGRKRSSLASKLYLTYLSVSYPGLHSTVEQTPSTRHFYEVQDRRLAYHAPIALLRSGQSEEAAGWARRLSRRMPPDPAFEERRTTLQRFADDVEAGKLEGWSDAWSAAHGPIASGRSAERAPSSERG